MNLLNHLSWTSYLEAVCLLLVIYYLFIGLRYYADDLRRLVNQSAKNVNSTAAIPDALHYGGPEEVSYPGTQELRKSNPDNRPDDSLSETDSLIGQVKQVILAASGKPFSPAILLPQIKKLLRANPGLRHSPHRPAINELIVAECERTGTALLTEDEVDQWWSD